jgi:putative SOS response-associated peptidase YedK
MQVIIMPDLYNCWLDRKDTAVEMADFLAIDAYRTVQLTQISTRVNNLLHNDEACLV